MNSNTSQRTWVSSVTIFLDPPTPSFFASYWYSPLLFSDRPRSPDLGEIVFHLGSQDTVATMAWHYQEPRAITNVKVLPVPFSITTEEDVPVDIKVLHTPLQ